MKFKLDENFGIRTQNLLRRAGHEVDTVRDEGLQGAPDDRLYDICCSEQMCLVTMDLDFADIIRFPANRTGGIAVIRAPGNPGLSLLESLIRQFINMLPEFQIASKLWIVEPGRIRVHQTEED